MDNLRDSVFLSNVKMVHELVTVYCEEVDADYNELINAEYRVLLQASDRCARNEFLTRKMANELKEKLLNTLMKNFMKLNNKVDNKSNEEDIKSKLESVIKIQVNDRAVFDIAVIGGMSTAQKNNLKEYISQGRVNKEIASSCMEYYRRALRKQDFLKKIETLHESMAEKRQDIDNDEKKNLWLQECEQSLAAIIQEPVFSISKDDKKFMEVNENFECVCNQKVYYMILKKISGEEKSYLESYMEGEAFNNLNEKMTEEIVREFFEYERGKEKYQILNTVFYLAERLVEEYASEEQEENLRKQCYEIILRTLEGVDFLFVNIDVLMDDIIKNVRELFENMPEDCSDFIDVVKDKLKQNEMFGRELKFESGNIYEKYIIRGMSIQKLAEEYQRQPEDILSELANAFREYQQSEFRQERIINNLENMNKIVNEFCRKKNIDKIESEKLIEEGYNALFCAVDKYSSTRRDENDRKAQFSTYFYTVLNNRLKKYMKKWVKGTTGDAMVIQRCIFVESLVTRMVGIICNECKNKKTLEAIERKCRRLLLKNNEYMFGSNGQLLEALNSIEPLVREIAQDKKIKGLEITEEKEAVIKEILKNSKSVIENLQPVQISLDEDMVEQISSIYEDNYLLNYGFIYDSKVQGLNLDVVSKMSKKDQKYLQIEDFEKYTRERYRNKIVYKTINEIVDILCKENCEGTDLTVLKRKSYHSFMKYKNLFYDDKQLLVIIVAVILNNAVSNKISIEQNQQSKIMIILRGLWKKLQYFAVDHEEVFEKKGVIREKQDYLKQEDQNILLGYMQEDSLENYIKKITEDELSDKQLSKEKELIMQDEKLKKKMEGEESKIKEAERRKIAGAYMRYLIALDRSRREIGYVYDYYNVETHNDDRHVETQLLINDLKGRAGTEEEINIQISDGNMKIIQEKIIELSDTPKFSAYIEQYVKNMLGINGDKNRRLNKIINEYFRNNGVLVYNIKGEDCTNKYISAILGKAVTAIDRKDVFLFAFGLNMDVDYVSYLLKDVIRDTDFNFKNAEEVIYYWLLSNDTEKILLSNGDEINRRAYNKYEQAKSYCEHFSEGLFDEYSTFELFTNDTNTKILGTNWRRLTTYNDFMNMLGTISKSHLTYINNSNTRDLFRELMRTVPREKNVSMEAVAKALENERKAARKRVGEAAGELFSRDVLKRILGRLLFSKHYLENRTEMRMNASRNDIEVAVFLIYTQALNNNSENRNRNLDDYMLQLNKVLNERNMGGVYVRNPLDLFCIYLLLTQDDPYRIFMACWDIALEKLPKEEDKCE